MEKISQSPSRCLQLKTDWITCNPKKTFSGMISGLLASDIFKFLESENIVYLDLYKIFNKKENPLNNWFYLGSHLSDLGAKNTVDELVKKLN